MSKYASLHAGLLARKGEASPAIPSSFANASYVDAPPPRAEQKRGEPPTRSEAPMPERRDIEALSSRMSVSSKPVVEYEPRQETPPAPEPAPPAGASCCDAGPRNLPEDPHAGIERTGRAEVRLTAEQRRRLRTLAVQMDWSQQRILSDALDAWLDRLCETEMRGCACLRARPE